MERRRIQRTYGVQFAVFSLDAEVIEDAREETVRIMKGVELYAGSMYVCMYLCMFSIFTTY